ncbi:hypothetical protein G6321_00036945 [Bradyrhizobium barranii subsp. barranii]|uniref:Uncharacterized protein n=1 Tax=Bradyrhizobium barranii subsp. barranii TaxID=2823807 RepID=A0A7Z0QG49_9BRAD|nr:hypothetical protein [Bradyrhizobium barranii]UGX91324.1 hypothetical protein G6321_00036945 [Bradyrhizobium barranii subsp. barranii]
MSFRNQGFPARRSPKAAVVAKVGAAVVVLADLPVAARAVQLLPRPVQEAPP